MTSNQPTTTTPDDDDAEARQIEAQFAGLDNDLVEVEAADGKPEARDDTLSADEIDETSAGGLDYPPSVRTSKAEPRR